jgi:hypothetical protein
MSDTSPGFVPFRLLSFAQAKEAIALRPKWNPLELRRFSFWVKADGHISKRNGHHTLTDEEAKKLDAMLRGDVERSKDWTQP